MQGVIKFDDNIIKTLFTWLNVDSCFPSLILLDFAATIGISQLYSASLFLVGWGGGLNSLH